VMAVGLGLAIFQQIVGVNTVIYYAPTILQFAGLNASSAITEALLIGVTNVVFTVVAILVLDRVGRRFLLFAGTIGLTLALVALGIFFASSTLQDEYGWIAVVALVVYIGSFAVGLGPVFWLMISEIYPLSVRSDAMSVSTVANWGSNFAISFTFLTLTDVITKQGTFWLYAAVGVAACAFFWWLVPETRGKSLEDIQGELVDDAAPQGA
jgi:MFS family permease